MYLIICIIKLILLYSVLFEKQYNKLIKILKFIFKVNLVKLKFFILGL